MKVKLTTIYGGVFIPIPKATLEALGWTQDDEVNIEPVVTRAGVVDYLVIDKTNV